MKNFIQIGDVLDHTPQADVSSGALVVIGVRVGVAVTDIKAGNTGALRVKGVAEFAKKAGDAPAQGVLLYWDAAASNLTTTAGGNTLAGYAAAPAGAGTTTVALHLNG